MTEPTETIIPNLLTPIIDYKNIDESLDIDIDFLTDTAGRNQLLNIVKCLLDEKLWLESDNSEFLLHKHTDGITNVLFQISHPTKTPFHVLCRIYGRGTSSMIDRSREVMLLSLLHKSNISSRVYGTFNTGFVYSFVVGNPLDPKNIYLPENQVSIAKELAKLHSLKIKVPLPRIVTLCTFIPPRHPLIENNPKHANSPGKDFFHQLRYWTTLIPDSSMPKYKLLLDNELNQGILAEVDALELFLASKHGSIYNSVFSHNDLLGPNIVKTPDKSVKFLDFEYALHNYPQFDIANHFWEYCGFDLDPSLFPSLAIQRVFVVEYLKHSGHNILQSSMDITSELDDEQIDAFLESIQHFVMVSHFLWATWALIRAPNAASNFNFMDYAVTRFKFYNQERKKHIGPVLEDFFKSFEKSGQNPPTDHVKMISDSTHHSS